jgi:hypothetical protein
LDNRIRGGALVGTAAGGMGAGPGALVGFVGGAISTGVANSILSAMGSMAVIENPQVILGKSALVDNLVVTKIWTNAAFDSHNTPNQLTFNNGLIIVGN